MLSKSGEKMRMKFKFHLLVCLFFAFCINFVIIYFTYGVIPPIANIVSILIYIVLFILVSTW